MLCMIKVDNEKVLCDNKDLIYEVNLENNTVTKRNRKKPFEEIPICLFKANGYFIPCSVEKKKFGNSKNNLFIIRFDAKILCIEIEGKIILNLEEL